MSILDGFKLYRPDPFYVSKRSVHLAYSRTCVTISGMAVDALGRPAYVNVMTAPGKLALVATDEPATGVKFVTGASKKKSVKYRNTQGLLDYCRKCLEENGRVSELLDQPGRYFLIPGEEFEENGKKAIVFNFEYAFPEMAKGDIHRK